MTGGRCRTKPVHVRGLGDWHWVLPHVKLCIHLNQRQRHQQEIRETYECCCCQERRPASNMESAGAPWPACSVEAILIQKLKRHWRKYIPHSCFEPKGRTDEDWFGRALGRRVSVGRKLRRSQIDWQSERLKKHMNRLILIYKTVRQTYVRSGSGESFLDLSLRESSSLRESVSLRESLFLREWLSPRGVS